MDGSMSVCLTLTDPQTKYKLRPVVVAWLSGSALVSINVVTYSTLGPVNTWMGDRLWVIHLGHLGQLSLSSFWGR